MDGHVSFLEEVWYLDSFREWLSDNLRYICLILGILIVLIGVFFGVRTVTRVLSKGSDAQKVQEDSIVAGSGVAASTGNSAAGQTPSSAGSTAVATPTQSAVQTTPAASVTPSPDVTQEPTQAPVDENAEQEVADVINTYYAALNTKSIDAIRAVTERLSESDILSIEVSETQYSDLSITVRPGPGGTEESAIAYVSYRYINPTQFVTHPGLSWLYLRRGEDGAFRIVVNQDDLSNVEPYVNDLTATPEIQAILEQVRTESEQADAEEALQAEASENWEQSTEGTEAAAVSPGVQPTETIHAMRSATINATCNLRGGEGYDYPVLTVLPQGTAVTVIGEVGQGWCHIQTEFGEGYVGSQFVSIA